MSSICLSRVRLMKQALTFFRTCFNVKPKMRNSESWIRMHNWLWSYFAYGYHRKLITVLCIKNSGIRNSRKNHSNRVFFFFYFFTEKTSLDRLTQLAKFAGVCMIRSVWFIFVYIDGGIMKLHSCNYYITFFNILKKK